MPKVFGKTKSVCPVCLKVVEAERAVGEDGNIYLQKTCPEHGEFRTLIWEGGIVDYLMWDRSSKAEASPEYAVPVRAGCPYDCGLCEAHESRGCCVLLELTNRCNLRCPVCFAAAGEREAHDLPMAEIESFFDMLMNRGGPYNIQLSGGEPTMRDDLPEIIRRGYDKGFSYFQLNTNGLRLAEEPGYAGTLKNAGLSSVFLQFDGVDDKVCETLRGRPLFDVKKRAVENCNAAGLGVVLVPVIAPGVNEDQVGEILRFAMTRMPGVRGVHFQPVSYFGRCGLAPPEKRITIPRMLRLIETQTGGVCKAADFTGGGPESAYCSFHASYMRRGDGSYKALPRRARACSCATSADTKDFVARQWGDGSAPEEDGDMTETSALDEFLEKARENTFSVSGMLFQDAWNLDLDRLRRCKISEADGARGMVPFCAYNLTDINGKALYRK
ncbi:MAG: radical SAM protein [Clostridia bacterium]|nr:radical SAM protein [Clostridia bacterium]